MVKLQLILLLLHILVITADCVRYLLFQENGIFQYVPYLWKKFLLAMFFK